jgi:hypothetical protein
MQDALQQNQQRVKRARETREKKERHASSLVRRYGLDLKKEKQE